MRFDWALHREQREHGTPAVCQPVGQPAGQPSSRLPAWMAADPTRWRIFKTKSMDYKFQNLLGAPYKGGTVFMHGDTLLTPVGNRVSQVRCVALSTAWFSSHAGTAPAWRLAPVWTSTLTSYSVFSYYHHISIVLPSYPVHRRLIW